MHPPNWPIQILQVKHTKYLYRNKWRKFDPTREDDLYQHLTTYHISKPLSPAFSLTNLTTQRNFPHGLPSNDFNSLPNKQYLVNSSNGFFFVPNCKVRHLKRSTKSLKTCLLDPINGFLFFFFVLPLSFLSLHSKRAWIIYLFKYVGCLALPMTISLLIYKNIAHF